jgi:hypothetical protein
MAALSWFPFLSCKEREAAACGSFPVVAVTLVAVCFLVSCADADPANVSSFQGESDDWVGTCPATFAVGTPTGGMIGATLTVMCDHRPTLEETMSGPFVPGSGHYHAVVTGIKTAQNFNYGQDQNFDLTLDSNGCSMSGTVTDADGSSKVSFDSTAQDCP